MTELQANLRTQVQFRAIPLASLNAASLGPSTDTTKQAAPGQLIMAATDEFGILYTRPVSGGPYPSQVNAPGISTAFTLSNLPGDGVQAIATQAAAGVGVRNICTGISGSLYGVAAIGNTVLLVLRNGAPGVGAVLWLQQLNRIGSPANQEVNINLTGLFIPGSANTQMTLECSAAAAGAREIITLTGFTAPG